LREGYNGYLAIKEASKKWSMPIPNYHLGMSRLLSNSVTACAITI